ncbi:MAG: amidophosphoribosyltransferase [candidate division NC10 bacterium]|nr:amidophosphoribosyltransferase [candidate division NC10 bacterium]MCH7896337.1 amidophosphoribosyltransferase [candidate division NC10 bacterium]
MSEQQDKFRDECGVFGIYGHPEAANLTYLGLYALQHRGQESAGIACANGKTIHLEKAMGLVADVFSEARLRKLPGETAIGHVRYSTTGSSQLKNAQPFLAGTHRGSLALAHNGNLINALRVQAELESQGSVFSSTSDTEVILHLVARSRAGTLVDAAAEALSQLQGAYSLALMNEKQLLGVRDPRGFRPLSLGQLKESYVLASESCAFDLIGATFVRDLDPGEFLLIDESGVHSYFPLPVATPAMCIFEHVYFARPDSLVYGQPVSRVRKELGRSLAQEAPADADVVIAVPDSGIYAALGYGQELGLPYEQGMVRNHYVGRTFIEPQRSIRHFGVKVKLNAVRHVLEGKRIVVVDDSIIRGTTSRKIVFMLRSAGAREVHMRISSPPTSWPCYYGIDTPTRRELIASSHSVEEIRRYIGADSLAYLSLKGLLLAVGKENGYCAACWTGRYPVDFPGQGERQLTLFEHRV